MISVESVISIAQDAGKALMPHLRPDIEIFTKDDGSSYTLADMAAHNIVVDRLTALDPTIPILSEEGTTAEKRAAQQSSCRWLTDPLDGSLTSIQHALGKPDHEGFGVHIALLENNVPVMGVVHFPAKGDGGVTYYTGDDGRAYRQDGIKKPVLIHAKTLPLPEILKTAVSWRPAERPTHIAGRPVESIPEVGGGRLCITADGTTHLACVDHPFSHWDVAASHAILKAAGGELVANDSKIAVTYDDPNFIIPPCMGGHKDILHLLGLAEKFPAQGRAL